MNGVFNMTNAAREREIVQLEKNIRETTDSIVNLSQDHLFYFDNILKTGPDVDTAKALHGLDEQVAKIEEKIKKTVQNHPSSEKKIEVIRQIERRLAQFSNLRDAIKWLNTDFSQMGSSYRSHAMKLKNMMSYKHIANLVDVDSDLPETEVFDKFNEEVNFEVQRFASFLYGLFDTFVVVAKDGEDMTRTVMSVSSLDSDLISDVLDALILLNAFKSKFTELTSVIWTDYCDVLLSSTEPEQQVIVNDRDETTKEFISQSKPRKGEKQNPVKIVKALESLFKAFHAVFNDVVVERSNSLCRLIGDEIGSKLVETLILRCFAASVTVKRSDDDKIQKLREIVSHFDRTMKSLNFFAEDGPNAEELLNKSNRLLVNQRCRAFLAAARSMIAKPYVDLVPVPPQPEPSTSEIEQLTQAVDNINLASRELSQPDSLCPKLFEFQNCKISESISKLVPLVRDLFDLAVETKDEMEAVNYVQAALIVVDTFLVSTPRLHQQTLLSIPQTAAVFYNNCQFLSHSLFCVKVDVEARLGANTSLWKNFDFRHCFVSLRHTAVKFLDQQIGQVRRQLDVLLNNEDLFVNIDATEESQARATRAVNGCLMELEKLRTVWSEVQAESVLCVSMGILVGHFLNLLNKIVLSKVDITVRDSESMARIFGDALQRINGEEGIHASCRVSYGRLNEIVFMLNASLADISDRWCNGLGTLAAFLKPFEVRGLVCALFQNTPKRSELLDEIKDRRPGSHQGDGKLYNKFM